MLGAWSFEKDRKRFGEAEYRKALSLFPYDPFLSYNMAEQYRKVGMCQPALPLYRWTRGLDPHFPLGRAGYAQCLLETGSYDEAKAVAFEAMSVGGELKRARRLVFLADSAKAADARKGASPNVGLAGTASGGKAGTPSKVPEIVQKTARPSAK
jgi:predicted Zn-dependent protease